MSAATTDSGHHAGQSHPASGHGHGSAGHGGGEAHGAHESSDRASVVLAVLLAGAFLFGAWYLSNWGVARRNDRPEPAPGQPAATAPAETKVVGPAASGDVGRRTEFAATFEQRQRARGHGLEVRAAGPAHDALEINWTTEREPEHVEQIKKAKPFLREARAVGFTRLVLKVVGREVFSRLL